MILGNDENFAAVHSDNSKVQKLETFAIKAYDETPSTHFKRIIQQN